MPEEHQITVEAGHGAYMVCTCGWTGNDVIGPEYDDRIENFWSLASAHYAETRDA